MTKNNKINQKRLPVHFHQTFIPERRYISALLRYAASEKQGTDQEISASTGIPVGQSSGKVPSIINYCIGMGLISIERGNEPRQKRPVLTDFGRIVLIEDSNLSEPLSQWIAHINLCRRIGGAEVWQKTFGPGRDVLGMKFSESDLDEYLNSFFGKKSRSHIGPMIRTYEEESAFKNTGSVTRKSNSIERSPAPLLNGFGPGYSALILSLWDDHFLEFRQVTLTDFEEETYWQRIMGWSDQQLEMVLEMIQANGAIDVDRQIRPWIILRRADSKQYWRKLFGQLV